MRTLLLACLGLAIAWILAAAVLFVWPPHRGAGRADVVVVLAGGRGPRLAHGIGLVRRGVAPVLVISDGWAPTWPEANRLCAGRPAPVPIVCFHPGPYSTRGEAETFSRLARDRGWTSAVVVSSRYHVTRAGMLFDRCFDGRIATDGANQSLMTRLIAIPTESAKLAYALLLGRSC